MKITPVKVFNIMLQWWSFANLVTVSTIYWNIKSVELYIRESQILFAQFYEIVLRQRHQRYHQGCKELLVNLPTCLALKYIFLIAIFCQD